MNWIMRVLFNFRPAMSLRFQINIRILFSSMIILLLGGAVVIWQAKDAVNDEVDSSVNLAFQLIKQAFSHSQQVGNDDGFQNFIAQEQARHLKIKVLKPSGEVIHYALNNEPESFQSSPPQWFVKLVSSEYPEATQQFTTHDGHLVNIVIQANPLDEITEVWEESCSFFALIFFMILTIFLAVNLVFAKALKSINIIVERLQSIEQGQYQTKLPPFSVYEYDCIAKAINHMTDVLDNANQQNKSLTLHSLQIQEEERQHLSQELHDELGQSLTAIKMMALAGNKKPQEQSQINNSIISICEHMMRVVRSMMRNLHPLTLSELGLKAGLEDLLEHWAVFNPELKLNIECEGEVDELEQNITIQLYRVIQECLTNIMRHAQAKSVEINVSVLSEKAVKKLVLKVQDDGIGCDLSSVKSGFGLMGMKERITSLGGTFSINTQPDKGMAIMVEIGI